MGLENFSRLLKHLNCCYKTLSLDEKRSRIEQDKWQISKMLFVQILFVKSAFLSLTKHKICRAKLPETLLNFQPLNYSKPSTCLGDKFSLKNLVTFSQASFAAASS